MHTRIHVIIILLRHFTFSQPSVSCALMKVLYVIDIQVASNGVAEERGKRNHASYPFPFNYHNSRMAGVGEISSARIGHYK